MKRAFACVLLVACAKNEAPKADAIPAPAASETSTTTSVAASASVPASVSVPASASASALATASPKKPTSPPSPPSATAKPAPSIAETALVPASSRVSGKNFTLDVASPGCREGATCTVTLRLATSGEFHVNKEYPYKFLGAAAPGVTFLGTGDGATFSRAAGDFREEGEKTAVMTVRFKAAAGTANVTGTYKLSVCSAEACQIEQQAIALSVPVQSASSIR